jgi:tetratricopeptide (TPR) repeat protein
MAKICDVCQQPYSEDLAHCPFCATAPHAPSIENPAEQPPAHAATEEYVIGAAPESGDEGSPSDIIEIDWANVEGGSQHDPASADVLQSPAPASAEAGEGSALFGKAEGRSDVPGTTPELTLPGHGSPVQPAGEDSAVLGEQHAPRDDTESEIELGERFDTGSGGLSTLDRMRMAKKLSRELAEQAGPAAGKDQLEETILDPEAAALPPRDLGASDVDLGSRGEGEPSDSEAFDLEEIGEEENAESGQLADEVSAESEATEQDLDELAEMEAVEEGQEQELDESTHEFEIADVGDELAGPPPATKRLLTPWLGGGVVGAGIGSAVCLALAMMGFFPGAGKKSIPPPVVASPTPPPERSAPRPAAPPSQEDPGVLLSRGEFDKAIQAEGENAAPEALARRGQARWLALLGAQKSKSGTIAATDPALKAAQADLEASKSVDGLFWLGHIQETTGDLAAARKTYEAGLEKSKNDPARQQMFQTALDRLASMGDEQPPAGEKSGKLPGRSSGQSLLVDWAGALLTAALEVMPQEKQAPEPVSTDKPEAQPTKTEPAQAPAVAAASGQEAGTYFWRAVRLAKDGKYDQAVDFLRKAKATHEQRRFTRLMKSQNPTSDPMEEIFMRSCDELQTAWQLRGILQNAGYLKSYRQADLVSAVEHLLSDSQETKQAALALQSSIAKLKKDKQVAAADPELKDASKALDIVLEAKAQQDAQQEEIHRLLRDAKYIGDDQTTASAALEKLIQNESAMKQTLANIGHLLQSDEGASNKDLSKGVEKLQEDKKAALAQLQTAEAKVEDLTRRLADVKGAKVEERPDQPVRLAQASTISNSDLAEEHYGAGLTYYWSGNYREASKEFARAIREAGAYDQDARFFYYFGLAQFQQGDTKDAADAFRRAVVLEQQNRPTSAAVNKTLERIQGEPRRYLDTFRP